MKKLMFILSFLIAVSTLHAQDLEAQKSDTIQHMKFMGIEMGGDISSFVEKIKQKGFKYESTLDGGIQALNGSFAGVNNCTIMIYPNNKKNVYSASVIFPFADTWSALNTTYHKIKSMLIQKYGEPYSCTEEFDSFIESLDDIDKMLHIKMGRCNYSTSFLFNEGFILEQILHLKEDCYVSLIYEDKEALIEKNKSEIEDL